MSRTAALFVSAAAVVAGANIHDRSFYEEKFVNWLSEHKVVARDGSHFTHMLDNFANNDDIIEAHNAKKGNTFEMGHNQFSGMSFDEFKSYVRLGLDTPAPGTQAEQTLEAPLDSSALPTSVDWTTKGAVTGVKDQGNCGSCWSFSATGALEGAYEIKYGSLVSFSEQNLVSCDTIDSACNGGLMDNAFSWTKTNGGLCTESAYPYTSGTTGQKGTCNQSSCTKNANVAPKSYTDVAKNSDSALMTALVQQPVSVAIQANQPAFQTYKSGVLTGTCGTNLDHGVLAVGYGTWTDGTDYYKVKNSWGTSWGMSGYILIQRGNPQRCGECGILCGPPSYPNL